MSVGKLLVQRLSARWALQAALLVLLGVFSLAAIASPKLYDFKIVSQDNLMLHFDLDATVDKPDLLVLDKPFRLAIDLPDTTLGTELPTETFDSGLVKGIRYAQHANAQKGESYLRIVLDLRHGVSPTWRMVTRQGGQRLVVDMGVPAVGRVNTSTQASNTGQPAQRELRDVVIAIDAGHGGKDPGAIGRGNTYEKDVVLAIAIRLHNYLVSMQGVRPMLVRETDTYIGLRERMNIARAANADVFVSIHADAINGESAHGSSVYALSLDGASSEAAAWLAKRENESAALYGDVLLQGMEDGLAQTLLNLTQGNTMERSLELGADVLAELAGIGYVHKSKVEQAAFAVLKSPDIPSILVETAFISNRADEKKLNNAHYQELLAAAMGRGLLSYLQRRAPDGTLLAAQRRGVVPVGLPKSQ